MTSVTSAAAMKLLDVRLKHAGSIISSVIGEFTTSGSGVQEIVCLRSGGTIDLYRIVMSQLSRQYQDEKHKTGGEDDNDEEDEDEDEIQTTLKLIFRLETRSILRSLSPIRVSGGKRDVVVVGSDSGCCSIIDFENGVAKVLHCPSFGKIGCRRDTPGQYVATDPRGRAAMIASVEKRKLVYVLNRDATGNVTLASPLEAHRPRTIVFDLVGMDNGYDNPIFASLEVQYPEHEDVLLMGKKGMSETGSKDGNVDQGSGAQPPFVADRKNAGSSSSTDKNNIVLGQTGDGFIKQVAYYELDLGLNHVSRRWAVATLRTACCLAAIPGSADGPSGVLVGGEDYIEYLHEGMSPPPIPTGSGDTIHAKDRTLKEPKRMICAIPRRELHPPNKGILITHITVLRQKKGKFFSLAQSELGDVYKVTLQTSPVDKSLVIGMTICLLDTLPVGNGLNISKLALLFVPSEFGDHGLYQFDAIDIEGTAVTCTSNDTISAFMKSDKAEIVVNRDVDREVDEEDLFYSNPGTAADIAPSFHPSMLRNLRKVFTLDSLAPITSVLVGELAGNEVSPQLYALCGRGPSSTLRILRHGLSVVELAVSELPGVPGAVFNVRDAAVGAKHGKFRDRYIVVSFADATLVLSVGETVEEMGKESGFLTTEPTLACSALGGRSGSGGGGICQVYPGGVRHIQHGSVSQWHVPGIKKIECASANESQILVALVGGELIYFELDPHSGNLMEAATRDVGADVCSLDIGAVPWGKSRSLFAAVGCRDCTVRLLSLAPGCLLEQKSSTALGMSRPHSVALLNVVDNNINGGAGEITLTVGLDDGSALRANVDPITGTISTSPSRRFLGARPVAVSRITLNGAPASLLLSSRPWIGRGSSSGKGRHAMTPMSYAPLDHGCSFSSEAVREGIVATSGNSLRILTVGDGGGGGGGGGTEAGNDVATGVDDDEAFNSNRVKLRYTPRQMCLLSVRAIGTEPANVPQARKILLALVESDCNDFGEEDKKAVGFDCNGQLSKIASKKKKINLGKDDDEAMDLDDESDDESAKVEEKKDDEDDDEDDDDKQARSIPIRGPIPSEPGHWGSCIRLVDPANACSTLDCVEMGRNEAALCCASVRFHSRGGESLLAVGTVTGMTMNPLRLISSHVVLYRVVNNERLQLLHKTKMEDGPVLSLVHFQGRLLVGIGRTIRLFEMGKRQLLKKCELRGLPTLVKTLQAAGDRAFVGDMKQSMQFIRYDSTANRLVLVAKDRNPRPITCQELLDLNTVAVGDKFGNVSILRLPRGADVSAIDVTGTRALWDSSREDATPKLETLCHYYVGEVVTGMTRASLVAGGAESLIYVTITGRVGALVPFNSRDDVEFYTTLEGFLRTEAPRPTGREPQAYRSYYAPVKHVIDGDLCEAYAQLPFDEKQKIAEQLDRTVGEVMKKLEDSRNALL